ncbi:MAG: ABC transporter permease [Candidatus Bathyarchaeota archaeon]|nr:ABC transporter permease [Candidatus Bathyarchaeota archaeon]MDH5495382.1 ABC transporter permease [Candidatus Bathyarchaeota archaeon]
MKRVLAIVAGALRMWFRSKHTLFWTLAFPLLLMLLFGAIFSVSQNPTFDLYMQNQDVVDGEPTLLSNAFCDTLNKTGILNLHMVDSTENATQFIEGKGIQRMLIIPYGFHSSVSVGNNVSIVLKMVPAEVDTASATVKSVIEQFVEMFNTELTEQGPPKLVTIKDESIVSETFKYIDFFVPGIIGMTLMTSGIFGAVGWNTRNRKLGILKKLATTPLSKLEWIIGVVLYELVMGAISTAVILTVGVLVFNLKVLPNIYTVILIVSGAIAFPGIGMVIARFVKESDSADAAGNAITFPMMFLSGSFFPLEMMPDFLQQIAKALPLTYLNNGLRDSMVYGNVSSTLFNTAVMLGVGVFFIIVGTLITNWREE